MEQLVTATVKSLASLREVNVKKDNVYFMPGEFTAKIGDKQKRFIFKDEQGNKVDDFIINTARSFNLSNKIEKENWNTLLVLRGLYEEIARDIEIFDPVSESIHIQELQDMAFRIEGDIVKNKSNTEWLTKVFRRVLSDDAKGVSAVATGLTENQILTKLRTVAREDPMAFVNEEDELIYENDSFENLAKIDLGLERGFFLKDASGSILRRNKSVYAENIQKALFTFAADLDTQEMLRLELQGKKPVEETTYVKKIESSELVKLSNLVGEDVIEPTVDDLGGIDDDEIENQLESEINANIERLIEANFIEKNGPAWFKIPGQAKSFKKTEIVGFFKMNPSVYQDLKNRAKL